MVGLSDKECVRCGSFDYSIDDSHSGECNIKECKVESDYSCVDFSWNKFTRKKYKIKNI